MVQSIITNVSVVVSFLFLLDVLFRKERFLTSGGVRRRASLGLGYGLLGCMLIVFSIAVKGDVIIDLRHIAFVLSAFYGGWLSSLITAAVVACFRVAFYGFTDVAWTAAGFIVLTGIVCGWIAKRKLPPIWKFHTLNAAATVLGMALFRFVLPNNNVLFGKLMLYGWAASLLAAVAVYALMRFMDRASVNERLLRESERELRRTAHMLRALLNDMPSGLLAEDRDRRITYANRQYLRLFGEPATLELTGQLRDDVLARHRQQFREPELFAAAVEELSSGRGAAIEPYFELKDGRVLQFNYAPLADDGEHGGHLWKFHDVTDFKASEKKLQEANTVLKRLSGIDGLTGIANRRSLDEHCEFEWDACARSGKPLAALLIDVDDFKAYNDHYGHLEGDACLRRIAEALESSVKKPDDFVARYGGEEFAALLPDTTLDGAVSVAERMRLAVSELNIEHVHSRSGPRVTVSVGVSALVPKAGGSFLELFIKADKALYAAKAQGRNRTVAFDTEGNAYVWE
ncbi:diguanylate cyclase [Paenibacillus sp.]|uniref:GGDEF domain-containing protein n=1 Tax=Paenibacillus sp. TaxID=58172 RepID=UPI002D4F960F|nr:diguanylate cyclase [Paenibacillus sp.]HZG84632.1 diguanylate cyclase [Paenibacillus sp.]